MAKNEMLKGTYRYRSEDDVLYVRPSQRAYASSVQVGEFIFDIDKKGKPVGVEILNASKLLQIPKEALRHLVSLKLEILVLKNRIEFRLRVKALVRNGQATGALFVEREAPDTISGSLQVAVA